MNQKGIYVGQRTGRLRVFFFNDTATTEIYTLSLHDALPILGVNGLRNVSRILRPTVADLTPLQATCNYVTLWFRNVASLLSEGDNNGTWQRFIIVSAPTGPNNEGGPSDRPANGPVPSPRQAVPVPGGGPPQRNYLHKIGRASCRERV